MMFLSTICLTCNLTYVLSGSDEMINLRSNKHISQKNFQVDGTVPMISLFKQKRTKGWWPLYIKTDNEGLLLQVNRPLKFPKSVWKK